MTYLRIGLLAMFMLYLLSFKAPLHHGWADYNQNDTLDYTGVIQKFTFENPHATATVKQGNKSWFVVLAPTSRMESRGVPTDKLQKGASVRIVGYPHKTTKNEMRAERIYVDGAKFELR